MKKIIFILCLFISSVLFAQKPIKYKAVSSSYVERSNGKKGYSKPIETDSEIVLDIENKTIKLSDEKERIFQIIKSEPTKLGSNFSVTNYNCIDENKTACVLTLLKFSKPTKNGALQQFYISYSNIDYIYDINVVEN